MIEEATLIKTKGGGKHYFAGGDMNYKSKEASLNNRWATKWRNKGFRVASFKTKFGTWRVYANKAIKRATPKVSRPHGYLDFLG
jgi:hypothetical protein